MLTTQTDSVVVLRNPFLEIGFAINSGAIISMESVGNQLNPLTFTLPREEPGRVPFTGHFICAPRWGDPGEAELANGSIKHGDISSQLWDIVKQTENCLEAEAVSETDGILVNKKITMAAGSPVVCIEDNLTNLSAVRRPGNLVQHPTIASPFLNAKTRVDCSAAEALLHRGNGIEATACGTWPWVTDARGTGIDLRTPQNTSSAVYSFTSLQQPTSWITAFDPQSNLLLGYCWERSVYPWIHHWIHLENNQIKYRGLEFGTAGLHQPIDVIMRNNWHSCLNQPAYFMINPEETRRFKMYAFLFVVTESFNGIENVSLQDDRIEIVGEHFHKELKLS